MNPDKPCLCGSLLAGSQCCLPLIEQKQSAENALALMRSRYTAFALHAVDYLLATHHPSFREADLGKQLMTGFKENIQWLQLEIISHIETKKKNAKVEFKAYYHDSKQVYCLHERSDFIYQQNWFYTQGTIMKNRSVNWPRNKPCWCGSGRKSKLCHP